MQWIIGIFIGILVIGGAIYMVIIGNRTMAAQDDNADPLMARLAEFSERGELVSLEQIELSQPFAERVIVPVMRRLGEISARFTPQKVLLQTNLKLELAGNPGRIDASTFLASFHCPCDFRWVIVSGFPFGSHTLADGTVASRSAYLRFAGFCLPATLAIEQDQCPPA